MVNIMLKNIRLAYLRSSSISVFNKKIIFFSKYLITDEIPTPLYGYSPTLGDKFSTRRDDICENIFKFQLDQNVETCFNYLLKVENLLFWNSFIFQIFRMGSRSDFLFHIFLKSSYIPPMEIITPFRIVTSSTNEFFEFQNVSKLGMPFCGRVHFQSSNSDKRTKVTVYIRYPLPLSLKKLNINSDSYALIIQELVNSNLQYLSVLIKN
mmetsp:Transcript_28071/g.38969  ORF Transcript_28071/g.38969 Transcript_28071/m.38969 type:complete len:209 (+) Transcript_28071:2452-3078(+)